MNKINNIQTILLFFLNCSYKNIGIINIIEAINEYKKIIGKTFSPKQAPKAPAIYVSASPKARALFTN